jgi:hypothetical protein
VPLALSVKPKTDLMCWHQWLGHLNTDAVCKLANGVITGVEIEGDSRNFELDCLACIKGKHHKMPFRMDQTHATQTGESLHMDLADTKF